MYVLKKEMVAEWVEGNPYDVWFGRTVERYRLVVELGLWLDGRGIRKVRLRVFARTMVPMAPVMK